MNHKLYSSTLYLKDNTFYRGWSFFNEFICSGEIVFNTGMTGYQEIMTDPSYASQIVVFTYPELGNTGYNTEDNESRKVHIQGIVAKNISLYASNWRSIVSLKDYLIQYKIPHIFGIDTRSLTKYLRCYGVTSCYIYSDNNIIDYINQQTMSSIYKLNLVNQVSTLNNYKTISTIQNIATSYFSYLNSRLDNSRILSYNIVVLDFGIKQNIVRRLLAYGCNVYVISANTNYSQIQSYHPDGIILSNGPGDPSKLDNIINNVKKIVYFSDIPIFGICMGHQILSLAFGASTYKLKFGHRGLNHPTGLQANNNAEITSQNHGFAVEIHSVPMLKNNIRMTHCNLNDQTIAGILSSTKPIFSVQYHPEASPGPHDSDYLFYTFLKLIKILKQNN